MPRRPRSIDVTEELFWSLLNPVLEDDRCWEWPRRRQHHGHGMFRATFPEREERSTHRIAWRCAYGSIPTWLQVLHRCGNASCCRPSHLYLGTQKENMRDRDSIHHTSRWEGYVPTRWATDYDACIRCGRTDIRHSDHGHCRHCAVTVRRIANPEHARAIARKAQKRFRDKEKRESLQLFD